MGETGEIGSRRVHYPPEYRSGLGQEGLEKLKEFVSRGGVLVCLGVAANFAVENSVSA